MKKIILLFVALYGLALTGCVGSKSTSIKTLGVGPEAVEPLPLTADLNVSDQKVRGEASGRVGSNLGCADCLVKEATARALGQYPPRVDAPDVLVAMNVYKEPRGKDSLRVVVSGYPAWYHNFRTVKEETGDSAWLILTNTSDMGSKGSGGDGTGLWQSKQTWLKAAPSKNTKGRYLAVNRQLAGDVSTNEWIALEGGWLKSNGQYHGFEVGFGMDGDNYSASLGFNFGSSYDLPADIKFVYGASVGIWADIFSEETWNYYDGYSDNVTYNIGIVGISLKMRWKFIEIAYRGLLGGDMAFIGNSDPEYGADWLNQYRVGLYFEL